MRRPLSSGLLPLLALALTGVPAWSTAGQPPSATPADHAATPAPAAPALPGGTGDGDDHHDPAHDSHAHRDGTGESDVPETPTWEPDGAAPGIGDLSMGYTDQDGGTGRLSELLDRPVLLTFFYSRCQNSRKCPMTLSRLAALQKRLREAGLEGRVRLLAVTFEPQFDTPERLKRYATNRGLALGPNARALRLEPEDQQALVHDLRVPVSYNAGWVNGHGVELNLLDAEGRLVRKYHSVLWTGPRVVDDLRHMLDG